jgi:hypothetical protein
MFVIASWGSYLFLRDIISVLISFGSTVNVMFGVFFIIDWFKVPYSSLAETAILISLGFSVFLNTIMLCSIHTYKKTSETDAKLAIKKALTINFQPIILSFMGLALFTLAAFYQKESIIFSDFTQLLIAGSAVAATSALMFLPLMSNYWLGHINEERMQDDLNPSFLEKFLLHINLNIEKAAALLVWIISPIIDHKLISWMITAFTALGITCLVVVKFENILSIADTKGSFVIILSIVYFLFVVICYQSYALAFVPVFSMLLNYFLLDFICHLLLVPETLMRVCLYSSFSITLIGSYLQTDIVLHYLKNNYNFQDALLNALAKTLYLVFVSAVSAVIFIVVAMDLGNVWDVNLFLAGSVIICSGIILVFPVPFYLRVFFTLHEFVVKPRKKKIKSIYL